MLIGVPSGPACQPFWNPISDILDFRLTSLQSVQRHMQFKIASDVARLVNTTCPCNLFFGYIQPK